MCRRLPFLIWRLGEPWGVGWPVCLGGVDASCMKLQAFLWSALQFQLWGLGAESRSRCTKVHPIFCRIRFCDLWRISMLAQTGAAYIQIGPVTERYNSLSLFLEWSSQYRERNLSLTSSRFFLMCVLQMSFSSRWTPRYFTWLCWNKKFSIIKSSVTERVEMESKVYPYGLSVVCFYFPTLGPVVKLISCCLKVCWGNSVIFVSGKDCCIIRKGCREGVVGSRHIRHVHYTFWRVCDHPPNQLEGMWGDLRTLGQIF